MNLSPIYRPHDEAAATARLTALVADGAWAGLDAHRFEVVSRGDFVPGILYLPCPTTDPAAAAAPGAGAAPLVIVQHGLAGSKHSVYLECAARWVREGFAVAAIDLPLHGERSSPKLSDRLIQGIERIIRDERLDPDTHALVDEFARQSTSDLVRTLDALSALESIDSERVGYVGFSLGAVVGTYFLATDPRPKVAVLALAGGRRGPSDLDPAEYVGRGVARPILVVAAEQDQRVSAASSRALFEAARDPKEFLAATGDHGNLSGPTLGRIQEFLSKGFLSRRAEG